MRLLELALTRRPMWSQELHSSSSATLTVVALALDRTPRAGSCTRGPAIAYHANVANFSSGELRAPPSLLIVDDEPSVRDVLALLFRRAGYAVTLAAGARQAAESIKNTPLPFGVVLTDLSMPDGSGLELLGVAKERTKATEVIVMTAHSSVEAALAAMKDGAYDFVQKPFSNAELKATIERAFEKRSIAMENARLRAQLARQAGTELLGNGVAMKRVKELIAKVGGSRSTVLITGESGTGKERVARAVHKASDRANAPFLVVNCGALPEALLESELFGHEKGAFTGAQQKRLGIFREAHGGTVFLDEIGELPLAMQVKLLRVLQEKKVRGVGESVESAVDVRVLAATNRSVEDDVKSGKFRQDLYYRLNVIRVDVPPLRERLEDVPLLASYFLEGASDEQGKSVRQFTPEAMRALSTYSYPGNVRELENAVQRGVALAEGPAVALADLPSEVSGSRVGGPLPQLAELGPDGVELDAVLAEVERRLIVQALERTGGVRTAAAKLLGVTFRSLRYRMAKLGLSDEAEVSTEDPESSRS